jgi:CO/xanthine dehydrogenase FAD-binding subunit
MKPAPFDYVRPDSLAEACEVLAGDEDARIIAGGQTLIPMLAMRLARPARLVDILRLKELRGIRSDDDAIVIGAVTRQVEVERSAIVQRALPLLTKALPWVGHPPTRNRGTVGGSIAHADAAAELPLALTVLGGSVVTNSGRTIPAGEFFVTHFTTVLEPGELLVESVWPAADAGTRYAFEEFALRRGDFALCMAAAVSGPDGLRVALGSVVDRPTVVEVDPRSPGASAAEQIQAWGSLHASADYQRQLVRVLVDRVVGRVT